MSKFVPDGYEVPLSFSTKAGSWIAVSGQVGHQDFSLVDGGFEQQCRKALENLRSALEAQGATCAHVVKANVYLADLADFSLMNAVWIEFFAAPYPARTAIAAGLPFGALVEIEAWAYLGER